MRHSNLTLLILALRMKAYDRAKSDPHIQNPCKHVEGLQMKGFFRCCMFRWKNARKESRWSLLCEACPGLAKACREVPNVLRKIIGKEVKLKTRCRADGDQGSAILPPDFEKAITDTIDSWNRIKMHGLSWAFIYIYIYTYTYGKSICIHQPTIFSTTLHLEMEFPRLFEGRGEQTST